MLTDGTAGSFFSSFTGAVVNGALCGSITPGGTRDTFVVVSGTVSGFNFDLDGGTVMVVDGTLIRVNVSCDGGTSVGDDDAVSGTKTCGTSVGNISVLAFVFSLFGDVRDGESVIGTRKEGGFISAVFAVLLVSYQVVSVCGTFAIVFVVVVTWNSSVVAAAAS